MNRNEYNDVFSGATSLVNSIGTFISMIMNQENPNKKNFWFNKVFKPEVETTFQDLKLSEKGRFNDLAIINQNVIFC